jgi:hypothetical protein
MQKNFCNSNGVIKQTQGLVYKSQFCDIHEIFGARLLDTYALNSIIIFILANQEEVPLQLKSMNGK